MDTVSSESTKQKNMKLLETLERYSELTGKLTALDFINPRTEQFCINRRGQRLHLRTVVPPPSVRAKAIIFFFHGYGAHVNGPAFQDISAGMAANGYVVVMADAHGHGYSDGERVLIEDYRHLVDDCMQVVDIVARNREDGDMSHLGIDRSLHKELTALPFFLAGQSLGGAVALMTALRLKRDKMMTDVVGRFLGVMTNCPAIMGNPPPAPVVMILKYLVVPLFPRAQLPRFLERVSLPELIWIDQCNEKLAALDKIDKPGGLGWPGTMRVGTGAQLLDMLTHLQRRLCEIDFPFLVLHDPNDGIVRFEGTELLIREAKTSPEVFRGKEVKELLGCKHDLLANAPEEVLGAYLDWADARLSVTGKLPFVLSK